MSHSFFVRRCPEKNPYYKHGAAARWVLTGEDNSLIGRIAAFIDYNLANTYDQGPGHADGRHPQIPGIGNRVGLYPETEGSYKA